MPVNNEKVNEDRKMLVEAVIQDMKNEEPFFWAAGHYGHLNRPQNLVSSVKGKPEYYKGINAMTLMIYGMKKGFKDPRWCTYRDAEKIGAHVIKGKHGVPIEYWKFYGPKKEYNPKTKKWEPVYEVDEHGNKKEVIVHYKKPIVRRYVVFNAEQMENVPPLDRPNTISDEDRNMYFENMINHSEAPIYFDQAAENYYSPGKDEIHVMPREQFKDMGFFYSTVAHEIAHSTGASSRNNRPGITKFTGFGSQEYAKEELVAELSSMFLKSEFGIGVDEKHINNNKAYLRSWIKALEEDPDELYRAASHAEQAVDYIKTNMLLKDIDKVHDPNFMTYSFESSIREYYMAAFPTDELGEMLSDVTFKKMYEHMKEKKDIYELIEVGDSIVRERLFKKLAEISGKDYSEIYDLWLESSEVKEQQNKETEQMEKSIEKLKSADKKKLAEKVTAAWAEESLPTKGLPDTIIQKPKLPTQDIAELGKWYDYLRNSYAASTPKDQVDVEVVKHMLDHGLNESRIKMVYKNNAVKYAGYPSADKLSDILKSPEIVEHSSVSFKEQLSNIIDEHIKNNNHNLAKAR